MSKTALIMLLLLALSVAAQQDTETPVESLPTETAGDDVDAEEDNAAADEIDDSDLDEQTYEEDDDDFIPTEEIPADEPIAFPSNI
ncbi:MAG: hypothetical protein OEW68_12410 [Gammaproteobacteria bacterium]|nr:hypothetical protein [Gammaproteobacteria bacterium]MDH4315637.1 hypothetical protein [Gammaproteobacteria bacterium]MDH5215496.1 hypothetical protein [Gammaproteobacteria bacterium]